MVIDPIYSIGIEEMDTQHARWVHLIEEFKRATSGHLTDPSSIDAARLALTALVAYTKAHFASEEQFLADHQYPDLEKHRKQHRKLEHEVARLHDQIEAQASSSIPLRLNLLITVWLLEHITKEDAGYARFILAKKTIA